MMDNSLLSLIESAPSVLILLPARLNFDTAAAGLSLYLSLMEAKPFITVSSSSPITVGLNRIIGIQKLTSELGNKNLTIKFKQYDANNIEKVSYDIVNNEFNLTVVPKAGFVAPTQEQMDLSFSGVSADLIILVGGKDDSDFPALQSEELKGKKIIHIGNRGFSGSYDVISFARPGSSVSEVVAVMIKENNLAEMEPDIATNLVMGIEEGTGNFASGEVTPDTFEIFAYLLRSGGRRVPKVKMSPMGFPPGAIPTQPYGQKVAQVRPIVQDPAMPYVPQETDAADVEGTAESEQNINPPDDWLQPKLIRGAQSTNQPTTFSENKG